MGIQGKVQSILRVTVEVDSSQVDLLATGSVSEAESLDIAWGDSLQSSLEGGDNSLFMIRKVFELDLTSNEGNTYQINISSSQHTFKSSDGQEIHFQVGVNPETNAVYIRYDPAELKPNESYQGTIQLTIKGEL